MRFCSLYDDEIPAGDLKVFLDDIREAPPGWVRTVSVKDTIILLATGRVTHVSLDHDLGEIGKGYDVVLWIEEKVATSNYIPPIMTVHSGNPVGRKNMNEGILRIMKFVEDRKAA